MPDDTAAPAAASEKKPPPAVNPDRVGEELEDDARIWHVYDRVAKEDDERRTKAWDNGLNNLALFAGLFSAVTTAFIIEARQDLEPDYAQLTFLVLNATAFGEKPVHQPFAVAPRARTVNSLWIASLVLSLSAALIAIMGKDWIGMYTARPVCNLRQWAEMRTYRLLCVERWYMSGVIAAAPVLLHVSLLFFGAGLVLFISSDPVTQHLTVGLALVAGVLYLVTTLSAVAFSASPFKSPATQMIRAALSAIFSHIRSIIIYRPKRNLVGALLREINTMLVGGVENAVLLPGTAPETRKSRVRLHARAVLASAGGAAIIYTRNIPRLVHTARHELQWSRVQLRLHAVLLSVRRVPGRDWFLASTWTDLPTERRPKLLAAALSWLSGASQAPDVFRAIVFALGDLDIGPLVGNHTSPALCTRLRAEIRRTWQQVDFLTLSRYVLADQNTPGDTVLGYIQFNRRWDLSKDSALCCEDGIAGFIRIYPACILELAHYCPDRVAQPRMLEFLLPYVQKTQKSYRDVLIILSNLYRKHLLTTNSFSLSNLEAHLHRTLDTGAREDYATAITVKYGGSSGAIEILTFLCCTGAIDYVTRRAAVELVMELLEPKEHRCVAYLFGSGELWYDTWKDRDWSDISLFLLSESLRISIIHPFKPTSVRTLSDDQQFDVALARCAAMMLSPQNLVTGREIEWIQFLFCHLCQSPSPSIPDKDEQPNVIQLILDSAALLRIVGMPNAYKHRGVVIRWGTAILAAIISHLGRLLGDPATRDDGKQLFAELAHTEVKGPDGKARIWDLGEWLRTHAPEIAKRRPSAATKVQDVYTALSSLYPLCEHNRELRTSWDRIGYLGPPEDIAYLCDPYLDFGEFFARAEDPLSREGV